MLKSKSLRKAKLSVLKQVEKKLCHILNDAEILINVFNFSLKAYFLEQTKGGGILEKVEFVIKKVWVFCINSSMWLVDGWKHQNCGEK